VPGAVARRAKALERRLRNDGRPPAVRQPGEGLAAVELVPGSRSAGGIGLAPFDPAVFVEHGLGGTFSSGGGRSRLTLIVPDGVATVDATYPRVGPRARFTRPARFKTTIRRTYKVHENVVLATVERPGLAAFPRMVWRAADGTVVRRVPRP
jgi:hypothetical protein